MKTPDDARGVGARLCCPLGGWWLRPPPRASKLAYSQARTAHHAHGAQRAHAAPSKPWTVLVRTHPLARSPLAGAFDIFVIVGAAYVVGLALLGLLALATQNYLKA